MGESSEKFNCLVITPEATYFDGEADFVQIPAFDGEVGVMYGHAPLVARLGEGPLRVHSDDEKRFFYVKGGFAEVSRDRLTVLAENAEKIEEMTIERADEALDEARAIVAATVEELDAKSAALMKARGLKRIALDADSS